MTRGVDMDTVGKTERVTGEVEIIVFPIAMIGMKKPEQKKRVISMKKTTGWVKENMLLLKKTEVVRDIMIMDLD